MLNGEPAATRDISGAILNEGRPPQRTAYRLFTAAEMRQMLGMRQHDAPDAGSPWPVSRPESVSACYD